VEESKNSKDILLVYIDGSYSFSISRGDYISLNLYEEKELTEEDVEYIKNTVNVRAAKYAAVKYLSLKQRSSGEVYGKLKREGYDGDVIEKAIEELQDMGYINDRVYARKFVNDRIKLQYGRDTRLVYYDVTNYYFEIDEQDELRKKGVSKEHRPNPIVQMGLFMDTNGIPITFDLFPGNTNDCLTYRPILSRIQKEYELGKVIVVADKGMNTGDNIYYTLSAKDGYVFSMSVRGADKELKSYVLNEDGYEWYGNEYKRKSRLYPRTIKVTSSSGRKLNKTVDEKQVVFYSEKYAKRAKAERAAAIEKAIDLIKNPGKYTRSTSYGAASYVKNI